MSMPKRDHAAVLAEVHPIDHQRHQIQPGKIRGAGRGESKPLRCPHLVERGTAKPMTRSSALLDGEADGLARAVPSLDDHFDGARDFGDYHGQDLAIDVK